MTRRDNHMQNILYYKCYVAQTVTFIIPPPLFKLRRNTASNCGIKQFFNFFFFQKIGLLPTIAIVLALSKSFY